MRGVEVLSFALGLAVSRLAAAHVDTYVPGDVHEDVKAYLAEKRRDTFYANERLDRSRFHAETSQYSNEDVLWEGPSCAWMGELHAELESRTLFELTLPGTHNCGSYLLSEELMPGDWGEKSEAALKVAEFLHIPVEDVITPWSLTQDRSVLKQLELGSRYLDLRSGWNGKEWRTFHLEQGVLISDVLADVEAFLAKHPMEIVYLEVSHLVGSPTEEQVRQLASMIQKICSAYLLPRSFSLQEKTVGDIVRSGKRLVASLATSRAVLNEFPLIWPGYTFYNTYANTDDLRRMIAFNERTTTWFAKYRRQLWFSGFLFKVSWTLTPQVHTIVDSMLTRNPRNLYTLAKYAAEHFEAFSSWMNGRGIQGGNILLFDFLDLSINRTEGCESMVALVRAINPVLQNTTMPL